MWEFRSEAKGVGKARTISELAVSEERGGIEKEQSARPGHKEESYQHEILWRSAKKRMQR